MKLFFSLGCRRARHGSREDFLRAAARIVPEGVRELVIDGQPLVIANELRTPAIDRCLDRRIPGLRSDALVGEERRTLIGGLREEHIDEPVRGVEARVEERDADDSVGRDGHLRLELFRAISHGVVVDVQRR